MPAKYQLRFFFDYNCGGCLWSDNDEAFEEFGNGLLDMDITDMQGDIIQRAKIKLPESLRQKVVLLDKLFSLSIDWNNPAGKSLWDDNQWSDFYKQARQLHGEIAMTLGDKFEVVYKQE